MPNLASQMLHGILQHGLEHRLQIARRAGDDLQHLAGRGLLLQRLGQIVGALAQLVEQPRVLDGDHGLGGESFAPARSAAAVNGFTSWRQNDQSAEQRSCRAASARRARVPRVASRLKLCQRVGDCLAPTASRRP